MFDAFTRQSSRFAWRTVADDAGRRPADDFPVANFLGDDGARSDDGATPNPPDTFADDGAAADPGVVRYDERRLSGLGFWVVTVRVRVDDDRFGNDDALTNDQRATEIEDRVSVDLRMRADHAFRVGKFSIDARVPSYGYAVSELNPARESQGGVGQDADTRAAGPEISAPQCRPQTVGQTQSGNRDQLNEGHRQPR